MPNDLSESRAPAKPREAPQRWSRDDSNSGDGVGLLDLVIVLAKHKRLVIGLPLACALIAATVVLLTPNWYKATATILPPQQSQSNSLALLGQLGMLAGGPAQALGIKNPSDVFVAMLKSRTVADHLIERFQLRRVYDETLLVDARKELASNSSISAARDTVITVEVEDRDPKRAADIANGYVEELRALTLNLAVGEAGQRRLFFEMQVKKVKDDLAQAEVELKTFSEKSGTVNPEGQAILTVSTAASLRAQITAREVQLSAMRTFATDTNPDLLRLQREIESLSGELAKLERNPAMGKGGVLLSVGEAPEVSLEYLRRYRDVKYYETLFGALAKQYELARIDEAKDATLVQVLDHAAVPERKSRPKRVLIVLLTTVLAGVLGVLGALLLEAKEKAMKSEGGRDRVERLRRHLFGRA